MTQQTLTPREWIFVLAWYAAAFCLIATDPSNPIYAVLYASGIGMIALPCLAKIWATLTNHCTTN